MEEELAVARTYLAIEELRLGTRLSVEEEVDDAARACRLPPLLLQPLVENAIRHGALPNGGVAEVEIAATREGNRLHLTVRDNGPGLSAERNPNGNGNGDGNGFGGLGLANTRARLTELYGPSHRFELTNAPPPNASGALATIDIPYNDHARDHR